MSGSSGDTANDTDSIEEEEEEGDEIQQSPSPPPSQVQEQVPLQGASLDDKWEANLKVHQLIVKGVFSRVLRREEIITVLKKKFNVQQKNLTALKPTELMAVLAKKLARNDYCRLNVLHGEVKTKDDITIVKEITF